LQSHKKAGAMWCEAGLSWKDFLLEDEDVNKFVTEKVLKAKHIKSKKIKKGGNHCCGQTSLHVC